MLIGFGLTFGIWALAGFYFTRRMAEVERGTATINARYMRAQELLSLVRAQILIGSVSVRDALLDPDPRTPPAYREQLEDTYQSIGRALDQYVPVLDSEAERLRVSRLRKEIDNFQATLRSVLATDSARWPANARGLLSSQVVPKREIVITLSDEVQALNRSAFVQQQSATAGVYGAMQRRVWASLGVALAASFGIGIAAMLYARRLEDRIRQQRLKDAQNAHDLQQLSAKLITAQEEERRSIARELHDEVGQVLTAIKVELAVTQHAIDALGGGHLLDEVRAIADGALATVRDLSHLLHPALLDDLGLPAAVDWYLRGFGRRHGLRVEVLHDHMDERLAPEIEAAAYRIVQEGLTNVAKHAKATSCRVYLQRLTKTVLITIEDDGVGFDESEAAGPRRHGLGLIGIRERATQLRGTFRIETARDKGTRLTVELPAVGRARVDIEIESEPVESIRERVH